MSGLCLYFNFEIGYSLYVHFQVMLNEKRPECRLDEKMIIFANLSVHVNEFCAPDSEVMMERSKK